MRREHLVHTAVTPQRVQEVKPEMVKPEATVDSPRMRQELGTGV
jgi:hypothetical protein